MKYGIREICDVVLKAKARMKVGNRIFYKDEPVIYFDSLKTSTMEGAATTVYAQGGRGNTRLMAWEGERTVTFTMEDALISQIGLAILTGADVIAAEKETIIVHCTETLRVEEDGIELKNVPYVDSKKTDENFIYVMKLDAHGNVDSEPYLYIVDSDKKIKIKNTDYTADNNKPKAGDLVLVDYYTKKDSGATQIEITPDKFGGNFYLEASTLFRDTNGVDMPAEFIIPNCKVQSNFTFTMASSGDPSTFTFTMDAFPDYTRFGNKKVLSVIQIIEDASNDEYRRVATDADETYDIHDKVNSEDVDDDVRAAIAAIARIDLNSTVDDLSNQIAVADQAVLLLGSAEQLLKVYNYEVLVAAQRELENQTA